MNQMIVYGVIWTLSIVEASNLDFFSYIISFLPIDYTVVVPTCV